MKNLYTTEEETNALIKLDKRTLEQKKAAELADKNWMNEQGAEPQRTWVGLDDDEMLMIYGQQHEGKKYSLGRMVEAKLKEKNK